MARVTVEDCLKNVKNRFELVMIAAKRARQLMRGKDPKVEWDNDKATVVALREIAEGYTNFDVQESPEHELLHSLHHHTPEPQPQSHPHLTVLEPPHAPIAAPVPTPAPTAAPVPDPVEDTEEQQPEAAPEATQTPPEEPKEE